MPVLERRPLGRTGIQVTAIGLGGAGIGGDYGRISEQAAVWTVRKAVASGINLIDVSPAWGDSEAVVGKALTSGERQKTILSTKLAFASVHAGDIERDMEASIRLSLERLRVDRLDVLGLHRFVFAAPQGVWAVQSDAVLAPGGYLDCMQRWKQKGVVRSLSFTAWGDAAGVRALIECGGFDVCEMEYSLLHHNTILEGVSLAPDEPELVKLAADAGLGILGIRPLAGGALAGRSSGQRGDAHTLRDRQRATLLGQRLGQPNLVQAALNYATRASHLASVLVGCRQPEEVESAVAASRLAAPDAEFQDRLAQFHRQAII